jgi:hypothetical protein
MAKDKIKMSIDRKVFADMFEIAHWAKVHNQSEVAGWGHWTPEKGIYKLAPLLEQEASGAEVDTFPDAILNDVKYDVSDMTVQWHSHVDMSVFFSATDKKLIEEALELYPFLISIVVNCKGQYYAELNISRAGQFDLPVVVSLEVELVPIYAQSRWSKIVKDKVRKPKPKERMIIHPIGASYTPSENYYGSKYYDAYDGYNKEWRKERDTAVYEKVKVGDKIYWGSIYYDNGNKKMRANYEIVVDVHGAERWVACSDDLTLEVAKNLFTQEPEDMIDEVRKMMRKASEEHPMVVFVQEVKGKIPEEGVYTVCMVGTESFTVSDTFAKDEAVWGETVVELVDGWNAFIVSELPEGMDFVVGTDKEKIIENGIDKK